MSIFDQPELRAFRKDVRGFLDAHLTEDLRVETRRNLHLDRSVIQSWQGKLNSVGWGAPHWPEKFGGPGWDELRRYIFEEETAFADAPLGDVLGLFLAGPMIIAEGTPEQQARYLPRILSGEELWCQGFSEPDAGSDLASLQTSAVRDGAGWRINGQKTWLSNGHIADFMFCLARTGMSGKPQAGLSQFIIDMRDPGIQLHSIMTMDEGHTVNSAFIDDVWVPDSSVIGQLNEGWTYAKELLARERVNNAQAPRTKGDIVALQQMAENLTDQGGQPLISRDFVQRRLATLTMDYVALESSILLVLERQMRGEEPGPIASTLKIRGSELQQRVTETAMSFLDICGLVRGSEYGDSLLISEGVGWEQRHFFRRVVTIYAGSNEIQKTIIAKSILKM